MALPPACSHSGIKAVLLRFLGWSNAVALWRKCNTLLSAAFRGGWAYNQIPFLKFLEVYAWSLGVYEMFPLGSLAVLNSIATRRVIVCALAEAITVYRFWLGDVALSVYTTLTTTVALKNITKNVYQ